MQALEDCTLIHKDIKHARIKVSEDGSVRVLVPNDFTVEDIESLINKKSCWIAKQQAYFAGKSNIELGRNQLLLHGSRYSYFYDESVTRKVLIEHEHKTLRSAIDLIDIVNQEKWYKIIAKDYLSERTRYLSNNLGFSYKKLYVRGQRTKLGNCSEEKNISLNWRLIKAPDEVVDYIIVHELVHTRIMSHSSKFWILLKSHYPNYKSAIDWLDKYGNSL